MLVVIPSGGLGNRLIAMMSARVLAAHIGCGLQVLWEYERHSPQNDCPLSGLFKGFHSIPPPERSFSGEAYFEHHTPGPMPEIEERLKTGETVYLRSHCFIQPQGTEVGRFMKSVHREFDLLKPQPELLARVPGLPDGTVGIQIRRGDHWRATRYSPLALFFRVMDGHCRRNSEVQFYIASDSPRVHRLVGKRYGDRILTHESQPAWANEEGAVARQALVEILTLARSSCIYHSFMSSFSYISHLISRKPFFCVGLRDRPDDWNGSPADAVHDRLIEWNPVTKLWQKRALPDAAAVERLRAEWMFYRARIFCSKSFQLWPWHRMGPLE